MEKAQALAKVSHGETLSQRVRKGIAEIRLVECSADELAQQRLPKPGSGRIDRRQPVGQRLLAMDDAKARMDDLVAKAVAAGGSTYDKPEDLGFMYSHSFVDLDGHGWGLFCVRET